MKTMEEQFNEQIAQKEKEIAELKQELETTQAALNDLIMGGEANA